MVPGGAGVGAVGSRTAMFGAAVGVAGAAAGRGTGRVSIVGGTEAVVAVAVEEVGCTSLDLMLGGSRVAAAVAAAARSSRRKPRGRKVAEMRSQGWNSEMCVMERTERTAGSSGGKTGVVGPAFEKGAVVVDFLGEVVVGTVAAAVAHVPEEGNRCSEDRASREAAGCTPVTFCSYRGMAQDTGLARAVFVDTLQSHLVAGEVDRSCQIAEHYRSSSSPYLLEGSLAQQIC